MISGSKMKANLVTIFVGVFIALVSWVPFWIVEVRDPHAMRIHAVNYADLTRSIAALDQAA